MSIKNDSDWWLLAWLVGILLLAVTACQASPKQVFIEVDGGRQRLMTEAATVRDALRETNVMLHSLDRVTPDLYVELEAGMVIRVIRVTEKIKVEREIIPFERQTTTTEALPAGEQKIAQLGANGEDEVSIRVTYEDGVEVSRTEISRVTITPPTPEILVLGAQRELPPVPITGTIAYLAHSNGWIMRNSSGSRRAVTTSSDLDGRVFDLSPDGRHLLYTRKLTNEMELPLNELWLASTTIVGEEPIFLGLTGVLQAHWSPLVTRSLVAYSTANRTANPPGWQANNDLWLLDLKNPDAPKRTRILPANTQGLYSWWGNSFVWSPDGRQLAYARPDQIGVISPTAVLTGRVMPLANFPPLQTFSEWVWTPTLSWSPDGNFIAAPVHGPPLASEPLEESQLFDLWLFRVDGALSAKVAERVGMWSNPAWSKAGIAFGETTNPFQSATSRYTLQLIDHDGSNKRQLFPFQAEPGVQLPELAWSPQEDKLAFTYNGNLYMTDSQGALPKQLTADGQSSHPQWAVQTSASNASRIITQSFTITSPPLPIPVIPPTPTSAYYPISPVIPTVSPPPINKE
jgi:hypothetical protein